MLYILSSSSNRSHSHVRSIVLVVVVEALVVSMEYSLSSSRSHNQVRSTVLVVVVVAVEPRTEYSLIERSIEVKESSYVVIHMYYYVYL